MRKAVTVILILCLFVVITPMPTQAAVTPAFTAANDVILPFNADTMPFISGGEIFVPPRMFAELGIWSFTNTTANLVMMYRGPVGVNFWIDQGRVEDRDENALNWPNARRVGDRFYVPLAQVAGFFGLSWEVFNIRDDIVPGGNMRMVRITDGSEVFNGPTLVGFNSAQIRKMYNQHFHPQPPTPPGGGDSDEEPEEPIRTFNDVSIYLSFFNLANGDTAHILDILDADEFLGYRAAFFVSRADILENPGLIRRIHGRGHTLGIWLEHGTYEEYLQTLELLFEAAKVRTLLVSTYEAAEDEAAEDVISEIDGNGLIFWEASLCFPCLSDTTEDEIITALPVVSGERGNFRFAVSEEIEDILPGVLSFLAAHEFSVVRITETIEPVRNSQ